MTTPIEITHHNIQTKIKLLNSICKALPVELSKYGEKFINEINTLSNEYDETTLEYLCSYYQSTDINKKCAIVVEYNNIITSKNFVHWLVGIYDDIMAMVSKTRKASTDASIKDLVKQYVSIPIDMTVSVQKHNYCPSCHDKLIIDNANSEMKCNKCSYMNIIKGSSFDETNNADTSTIKRGSYETSRHCKYHLERILALKNPNMHPAVTEKIKNWIKQNNFRFTKLVLYDDYRRCLQDIKETRYNEYIPFIRQMISGISPERLYHNEKKLLYINFQKAVIAFNKIREGERLNIRYYPFFIYKILEMILSSNPTDINRLRSIIDCIHFQKEDTIVNNDKIWKQICTITRDFEFKITDRNLIRNT